MIKIRLSAFKESSVDYGIADGEKLSSAVARILAEKPEIIQEHDEIIIAVVNSMVIPSDMWDITLLKESDNVLLAPNLKSGDGSSLLRTALIAVAAFYLAPLAVGAIFGAGTLTGAAAFGAGLVSAGVVTLGTYAAFQLFPPPVLGSDSGRSDFSSSQVYTVTSQSNSVKKYGYVPKVYGTHRIFPIVAANPYVELEADKSGTTVQYFYAVYDFGLGPVSVKNIKIGNTPITEFSDVSYNLVDFNKPAISEGTWDDETKDKLSIYRGDVSSENVGLTINGNQAASDPIDEYQVIRNAGSNPNSKSQEIVLDLIFPGGLFSLSPAGSIGTRTVLSEIYFSKIGEDVWIPYNDKDFVSSYSAIGGDDIFKKSNIGLFASPTVGFIDFLGTFRGINRVSPSVGPRTARQTDGLIARKFTHYLGYPIGTQELIVPNVPSNNFFPAVGASVSLNGTVIGIVQSLAAFNVEEIKITLTAPTTIPALIYTEEETKLYNSNGTFVNTGFSTLSTATLVFEPSSAGRFSMKAASQDAVYTTLRFTPINPVQYKVRVRRVSTTGTSLPAQQNLTLTTITTRTDSSPIITNKRHTFLELRIKATGQINGNLQNLSAICTSVLDTWNGSAWVKKQTNNPAWIFADILTGEVSKRPVNKNRLDIPSLYEWAQFCDEIPVGSPSYVYTANRYSNNFILDFDTTVQKLLQQVSNSSQASLNLIDGKYGVLLDVKRNVPIQIFTPRNSRDFSSSRGYSPQPHAAKISFIDPNSDWQPNETIVYDNGYDELTATEFDSLSTFGVTEREQAFRFGRYFLAQNRLRKEIIQIKVDFEYLVCTRGDYVQVTQDTMKVGGVPARVKSITGNRIIIDEGIETNGLLSYVYVYRATTGEIRTNTLTVVSADTFDLNGSPLPQRGDLIIVGEAGKAVFDCIVKSINPENDLTASLVLIEKADAIYDIDIVGTLPDYDPQISNTVNPDFTPPGEVRDLVVIENTYTASNTGYEYYITTDWDAPQGAAYELFEMYVDSGRGYLLQASLEDSTYKYVVDPANLGVEHKFKVLAVSATGKKLSLGEVGFVAATPLRKMTPPSDVIPFNSDITGETLQLFWTKVSDVDTREYIIRFSPALLGTWETSTILQRVSSNTDLVMTQARTGIYLIKAVDFAGNESATATAIITTIPQLTGLNIIEELNDFPTLVGIKDQVEKLGNTLVLQQSVVGIPGSEQYYPEGYYYYENLLDLSEIYTVRLQSLLQAEGLVSSDIMSNWNPLSSVLSLYSPGSADWDVEAQYRSTESLNVMADWVTLDSIPSLAEGNQDKFTPWRKFIIGDATGRIFQFRLKLISNVAAVTPRVLNGLIRADMPDRREPFNNLIAPNTGLYVPYVPAFKGPGLTPNVQITLENGQSGDYWQFTTKTLEGFTIVFYDKNNNAVSRQFDASAIGYGRRATASI